MGIGLTRDFCHVGVRRQRHSTLAAEGRSFVFLQLPAGPVEKHEVTRGVVRLAEANQASQRKGQRHMTKSGRLLKSIGAFALIALVATGCSTKGVSVGTAVTTTSSSAATSGTPGGTTPTTAAAPTTTAASSGSNGTYAMGQTVTIPTTVNGIVSATIYGFYPNVRSTQPNVDHPPSGDTYAAIDAKECAGSSGASTGADESDFTILLSSGSTAGTPDGLVGNPAVSPLSSKSQLGSSGDGLSAGQCDRGWVVFDMPAGVTPTAVEFTGTTASLTSPNAVAKWTIS